MAVTSMASHCHNIREPLILLLGLGELKRKIIRFLEGP